MPEEVRYRPSPTALELGDWCEARFGARYIARIKPPEKPGKNTVGTRCHEIAAGYLSKGTAPSQLESMIIPTVDRAGKKRDATYYPGRIVKAMAHHLPPAGTVSDVERQMTLKWGGIEFNGYIDWQTDTCVADHKFTSNVKYAKVGAELVKDPQRILYAADWFQRHDANAVKQQWTYAQFDMRATRPVVISATRAEITHLMNELIMPLAERLMGHVARKTDWQTLDKNTSACFKFPPDGCPYSRECVRTKQQRVRMVMASSLAEKLKARKLAQQSASATTDMAPKTTLTDTAPSTDVEDDVAEAKAAIVGAINPPGEAADVAEEVEKPAAAPKRPRGRPAKAAAAQTTIPDAVDPDGQDSHKNGGAKLDPATDPAGKLITLLLVDCFPTRGMNDLIYASDLIAQAHNHIKAQYNVLDYRAGGAPEIEYGKGAGMLAACVEGLIQDLPSGCVVVLDTRSPEGQIALQPLTAASVAVVRGAA